MMRKDASFFMEYACTKKNKVPQEFHFIYFLEINFALLFYSYCIIFKTSPLPIRYKRHVAFFLLVSWMARPRPKWGRPRRTAWCTATWHRVTLISHLTPIRLTHVTLFHWRSNPVWSPSSTPRATLLSFALPSSRVFEKKTTRERERGGICLIVGWNLSLVHRFVRTLVLSRWKLRINVNKNGVYIDIIWLIYINTVSRCYCDYCIWISIGNINEQVKTMHVDG